MGLIHPWLESGWGDGDEGLAVDAVDQSMVPLLLLRQAATQPAPLLAVFPNLSMAEEATSALRRLLNLFGGDAEDAALLPEIVGGGGLSLENEAVRADAIHRIVAGRLKFVLASVTGLLSAAPDRSELAGRVTVVSRGAAPGFAPLLNRLIEMGYDDEVQVSSPGEFSRRGGIIDIFSPAHEAPARFEFWGDELESIRLFDSASQRSTGIIESYTIIPLLTDLSGGGLDIYNLFENEPHSVTVVFPAQCAAWIERFGVNGQLDRWRKGVLGGGGKCVTVFLDGVEESVFETVAGVDCFPATAHLSKADDGGEFGYGLIYQQLMTAQIEQWLDSGYRIFIALDSAESERHLREWLREMGIDAAAIAFENGSIASGIVIPSRRLVILGERELFSIGRAVRDGSLSVGGGGTRLTTDPAAATELAPGDYAVHAGYGIGIFHGVVERRERGGRFELIRLEFADNIEIFVPVHAISILTRYVGSRRQSPKLSKIGGRRWSKAKLAAAAAVRDWAAEMLRLQAMRESGDGWAYPADDIEQMAFERAFPFPETPDQLRAAAEIKQDMESSKPMDRLLCGDVGFGKTEVAMRAVFKAVMAGRQVAVLVPTTILAQQHYRTFRERFAEYPFNIDMLSRFRSPSEQRMIVERLENGGVDIVVGTHRLLQKDLKFKKLGLLIIDEEQRFGVEHKERLKKLRAEIDILTMTATPIPRTLYMGMTGLRHLSTINTAPNMRLPVKTTVARFNPELIKTAIEQELRRGGQVYFLHNRVHSIDERAAFLRGLVPDASFAVAHGRMPEEELETAMRGFLDGEIDVLVSTTIVESGLDIPNANTIIIERADRFGLAELYQLRGRVGRWIRQAHAYLLLPPGGDSLSGDARQRIAAMRRYTRLGSGFKLAVRDLEIRGAGNLLGGEQSGHINNIGFELYCQLLRGAVAGLKGETIKPPPSVELNIDFLDFAISTPAPRLAACLPPAYIGDEGLRLECYRRLSAVATENELMEYTADLKDRFGPPPPEAGTLIEIRRLIIKSDDAGFNSVAIDGEKVLLTGAGRTHRRNGRLPTLPAGTGGAAAIRWLNDYLEKLNPGGGK